MKRFMLLFVLAIVAITTSFAATPITTADVETPIIRIKAVDNSSFKLVLANLEKEQTKVQITDLKGNTTFFSTSINDHNGYSMKINLKNLAQGRYLLKVNKKGTEKVSVMKIMEEGIKFSHITTP